MASNDDSDDEHPCPDDEHPCLSDWNVYELQILLNLIREGSDSLETLQQELPMKTTQEITDALEYCRSQAQEHKKCEEAEVLVKKERKDNILDDNIVQWLKFLTSTYDVREIVSKGMADAVQVAGSSAQVEMAVNFKLIYTYLTKAMKGEMLPALNKETRFILNHCVRECVKTAKTEIKYNKKLVEYLTHINPNNLTTTPIPDPSNMPTDIQLKNLLKQLKFNPLKIPVEYLQQTLVSFDSDED